jgi:hypothetical protein
MVALCECGCGEPVAINKESHPGCGRIKGRPNRFVQGHTGKKKHVGEKDSGIREENMSIVDHPKGPPGLRSLKRSRPNRSKLCVQ